LEGRRPVITSAIEEIEPNKVVLGNNDHHTISTGGAGEALAATCSAPATTSDREEALIEPDSSFIACLPASASVIPAAATTAAAKEK